ncbi:hypothetical protein HML84_15130 [Alcanivorax sp. IO_7]|nr:hypothetical protein HML84_15130 [Alcanivorax sp. IO_7]
MAVYVNEVDDLPRSVAVSLENARLTRVLTLAAEPGEQQLFFALNDSRLSLADLLRVDRVATALREQDDLQAAVTGYADGAGDAATENGRDSNRRLARERADRVATWLADHADAGDRVANHGGQVQVPPPGEDGRHWRRVDLTLEQRPEPAPTPRRTPKRRRLRRSRPPPATAQPSPKEIKTMKRIRFDRAPARAGITLALAGVLAACGGSGGGGGGGGSTPAAVAETAATPCRARSPKCPRHLRQRGNRGPAGAGFRLRQHRGHDRRRAVAVRHAGR